MRPPRFTLACEDLAAGTSFFRDVLGLPVRQLDAAHVDVELGPRTATLTPQGAPGTARASQQPAVMLEVEVADIREAVRELRRRGGVVLLGPVVTEWYTESAFVAGPDGLVVELYRRRETRPQPQDRGRRALG